MQLHLALVNASIKHLALYLMSNLINNGPTHLITNIAFVCQHFYLKAKAHILSLCPNKWYFYTHLISNQLRDYILVLFK